MRLGAWRGPVEPADGRRRGEAWSRRRAVRALAALAAAPLLPACRRATEPLRVAAHVWAGYELLFLAAREGWLPPGEARLVETASATESVRALRGDAVDAAALTLDEVLRARADGVGLSVVLVVDVSSGADAVLARPEVSSAAQLAGRRVGVEPSAVGALMLHHLRLRAKLAPGALALVPLTPDRHLAAWRSGEVDALVTFEPIATQLESAGAVRVFDSREIPGAIVDVLAVRTRAIPSHGRGIRAAVAAHFAARRHLVTSRQDAAYRMSRHLRLAPPQVLDAFRWIHLPDERVNHDLLDGATPGLLAAARDLSAVMRDAALLLRASPVEDLVRPEFLPEGER